MNMHVFCRNTWHAHTRARARTHTHTPLCIYLSRAHSHLRIYLCVCCRTEKGRHSFARFDGSESCLGRWPSNWVSAIVSWARMHVMYAWAHTHTHKNARARACIYIYTHSILSSLLEASILPPFLSSLSRAQLGERKESLRNVQAAHAVSVSTSAALC